MNPLSRNLSLGLLFVLLMTFDCAVAVHGQQSYTYVGKKVISSDGDYSELKFTIDSSHRATGTLTVHSRRTGEVTTPLRGVYESGLRRVTLFGASTQGRKFKIAGNWDTRDKAFIIPTEDGTFICSIPKKPTPAPPVGGNDPPATPMSGTYAITDHHTDGCGRTYHYDITFSGSPSSYTGTFNAGSGVFTLTGTLSVNTYIFTYSGPGVASGKGRITFSGNGLSGNFSDSNNHTADLTGTKK